MEDNRKLKTLMFGIVDGTNKRGRPCREWMDDIVSWCKTGLQKLNSLAQDRRRWKLITTQAIDTNRRWSHAMVPEEDVNAPIVIVDGICLHLALLISDCY